MSWAHCCARDYEYWYFGQTIGGTPAIYRFKPEFWRFRHEASLTEGVEWQYCIGDGPWRVIPEGLETLEDKQAYVHTIYRLEGHNGNTE